MTGFNVPTVARTSANSTEIPNPLSGERHYFRWREHRIAYAVRGETSPDRTPVLLVHSIHAAAWSAEWRSVFEPLSTIDGFGPVYAIDLLGFGGSDRPPLHYTAQLYLDLIRDFIKEVIGQSPIVIGSSLGATYAIALEGAEPGTFREIIAVGPAGVSRLFDTGNVFTHGIEALFRSTVPGAALFRALVSPPSIRFFLNGVYPRKGTKLEEAVQLSRITSSHPNARFAPAAFVGMHLSRDIRHVIQTLTCPLHVIWGTKASQSSYREAEQVRTLVPTTRFTAMETGDLPHDELPDEFVNAVRRR